MVEDFRVGGSVFGGCFLGEEDVSQTRNKGLGFRV